MERNLPVKCPTATERDAPKFYAGYLSPPGKKVTCPPKTGPEDELE